MALTDNITDGFKVSTRALEYNRNAIEALRKSLGNIAGKANLIGGNTFEGVQKFKAVGEPGMQILSPDEQTGLRFGPVGGISFKEAGVWQTPFANFKDFAVKNASNIFEAPQSISTTGNINGADYNNNSIEFTVGSFHPRIALVDKSAGVQNAMMAWGGLATGGLFQIRTTTAGANTFGNVAFELNTTTNTLTVGPSSIKFNAGGVIDFTAAPTVNGVPIGGGGPAPDLSEYVKRDGSTPFTGIVKINNAGVGAPNEGGQIELQKPAGGVSTLASDVVIDVFANRLRFFENGKPSAYLDMVEVGSTGEQKILTSATGATLTGGNVFNGPQEIRGVTSTQTGLLIETTGNVTTGESFDKGVELIVSSYQPRIKFNDRSTDAKAMIQHYNASSTRGYMSWMFDTAGDGMYSDQIMRLDSNKILTIGGNQVLTTVTGLSNSGNQTLNGSLTLDTTGYQYIRMSGVAGSAREFHFQSSGTNRWMFRASSQAESGNDVGSNFEMYRYSDAAAGTRVLYISRATGRISFDALPLVSGSGDILTTGTGVSIAATNLGATTNVPLISGTRNAAWWSGLPTGYNVMTNLTTANGSPVNGHGYFMKMARRDADNGWCGLWQSYTGPEMYFGGSNTSADMPSWYRLWNSGNFNPDNKLDSVTGTWINDTSGRPRLYFSLNGNTFLRGANHEWRDVNDVGIFWINGSGAVTFKQNVWHGTEGGKAKLYFQSSDGLTIHRGNGFSFRNEANTEIASISNGGNMYAGGEIYCGNAGWFRVTGSNKGIHWEQHGGGWFMQDATWMRVYNNKGILTTGAIQGGTVTGTSDARLKTFIGDLSNAGGMIDRMRVRRFKWNESNRESIGLFAQELQKITPEAVHEGGNGYLTVEPLPILATTIKAVQETRDELKETKSRLSILEEQMAKLMNLMENQ